MLELLHSESGFDLGRTISTRFPRTSHSIDKKYTEMKLAPREIEKLMLHNAGELAQKRLARGLRLNHAEAVALIAAQVYAFFFFFIHIVFVSLFGFAVRKAFSFFPLYCKYELVHCFVWLLIGAFFLCLYFPCLD